MSLLLTSSCFFVSFFFLLTILLCCKLFPLPPHFCVNVTHTISGSAIMCCQIMELDRYYCTSSKRVGEQGSARIKQLANVLYSAAFI